MLIVKAHIRFLLHRPLQLVLTIFGIALGVAVVTAVDLANTSAKRAFLMSLTEVMGKTTHQIASNNPKGLNDVRYREFRLQFAKFSQIKSTPIVDGVVRVDRQNYRLVGIDLLADADFRTNLQNTKGNQFGRLFTDPGTVLMSRTSALRSGLDVGSKIEVSVKGKNKTVEVIGLVTSSIPAATEGMLIADIATAQELLDKPGYIDRIDLIINNTNLIKTVQSWLPQDMHLENAGNQSNTRLQTTRAFRINLQAMSLIAILVGGFLIFNTLTFSILQRRPLIGILRSLGVVREQIFTQVIIEALVLAMIGSILGIVLGLLIGNALVTLVLRTINDLYFTTAVSSLYITPAVVTKGMLIGMFVSVIAAFSPAYEAARTVPTTTQHRSSLERQMYTSMPLLLAAGIAVILIAGISLIITDDLVFAFACLFLLVVGYCLTLAPAIIFGFKYFSTTLRKTSFVIKLSLRGIPSNLSRTAIAIAALTVAVAATIGVSIMINSFRYSVEQWLSGSLPGDLYVSANGTASERISGSIPLIFANDIAKLPQVEEIIHTRNVVVRSNLGDVQLTSLKASRVIANRLPMLKGNTGEVWSSFDRGKVVVISESFARLKKLEIGHSIALYTDRGKQNFLIGGIVQNYNSRQGMVFISHGLYTRNWRDSDVSGVGVFLSEQRHADLVKTRIYQILEKYPNIVVNSNKEVYSNSLAIFDRTFTITHVLRLLAVGVAFCGVFAALLAFQMERIKEVAILRATGFTDRQIWTIIGIHTGVLGFLSGLFAVPLGLILAWALVHVINQIAFGWTMDLVMHWPAMFEGVALAICSALLASVYPAWKLARVSPAQALREE